MARDILIVDDEADIRRLIAGVLEDEGFTTSEAANADQAFAALDRQPPPNLVILDIWLENSKLDGMQILEKLRNLYSELPVVMISGHGTIETAVAALKLGAYDFIEKPFKVDHLLAVIGRALEAARLRRENHELRLRSGGSEELLGETSIMSQIRQSIERAAPTGSRVLITGAPGVGKEVAARMLHSKSRRADGPFVALNCAAMHPDRVEQEIFGIEASHDGGTDKRKLGTFEQAHGGTLLLDEVADMPLTTQGKIVRVLQDQTFHRVGGADPVRVDVRVIATSNRDLEAEIEAGNFREDLYYRLNVVPIRIPPLKQRRGDIPLIARHFMDRAAETAGVQPRRFTDDAIAALQAYEWPGNVRQLRNVIEWVLIMSPLDASTPIGSDLLPPEMSQAGPASLQMNKSSELMALPLKEARELFEKEYLQSQIDRFGGNISRTAGFIGMERSALHRKLKSLGLNMAGRATD